MEKKAASEIMLTLLILSTLTLAFDIQPVKASSLSVHNIDASDDFTTIQGARDAQAQQSDLKSSLLRKGISTRAFGSAPEQDLELDRQRCYERFGSVFQKVTLGSSESNISVPFRYQQKLYWCGPAALEMVLDYFSEGVFQFEVAEVARSYPWTTYTDELRRAGHFSELSTSSGTEMPNVDITGYFARKLGYAAFEQGGMTLADLRALVDLGYPIVVLMWYSPMHNSGHFRVVVGYNQTHMFVHDPWNSVEWGGAYGGPNLALENSVFLDLWSYSYYWGLLVSPWSVNVSVPSIVDEEDTFTINAEIEYPCPPPFPNDAYPASACNATLILPVGLSLASGETAKKTLGTGVLSAANSAFVAWNVKADNPGVFNVNVESEGTLSGTVYGKTDPPLPSYIYEDRVGGISGCTVNVEESEHPLPGTRDVAILGVEPALREAYSGQAVGVEIVAKNLGTYNETFEVSAYCDSILVGTATVNNLVPNGITNIVFNWNTLDVVAGNYAVKASATFVPSETNTTNNQLADGVIQIIKHPTAISLYTATIVNQPVTFNATKSQPNGGEIVNYSWDFEPDGTIDAYGPVVSHTYPTIDWYYPTLTILDTEGISNFTWSAVYSTRADDVDNIAVTDVSTSRSVVGRGSEVDIFVSLANTGRYDDTFKISTYADATIIQTKTVTLTTGDSTNIVFTWNTTGFTYGFYAIYAFATPFPGETITIDNSFGNGSVRVTIIGDVNGDGIVDVFDILMIKYHRSGPPPGPGGYDPNVDINDDGAIDVFDILIAKAHLGQSW